MSTPLVTLRDFRVIAGLLYRKAGLRFDDGKLYFIASRLRKRMQIRGLDSTEAYARLLDEADPEGTELQALVNLVTVNETYFFRDFPQLASFSDGCLSEIVKHKNERGSNTLRIWSVGCSSGEEAYTIAIIMQEMLSDPARWDIRILGSDIDRDVMEKAARGIYTRRTLRYVPAEYLERYFTRESDDTFAVHRRIRRMVEFEHLNIMDGARMREHRDFDFIFCRNVLIYFDDVSRRQVVDHLYVALNRPGFIFLGSSEGMGRITSAFTVRRISDMLVYGKEET